MGKRTLCLGAQAVFHIGRVSVSPDLVKVDLEISSSFERELDDTPSEAKEEAKKERGGSTKTITSCDNVERPRVVWGRGK
ncbi:hypothetical protein GCM10011389_06910 [Pontibacillus salipaludis]|uniref:Uncharacterized protein n=1 Tax=Pontibacillus salipaludis TaxID=1697394 RepID=A0ABQ1PRQ1_9BACI|nr:hypothetical protein GCM10011389_06910 [Pontibacillus salipaludis]